LDEVWKQVQEDYGQLRKAAEMVLPAPVCLALGQAFTTVTKIAIELHKTFTQAVLPKLRKCVLDKGKREVACSSN
jgi:hypothetical protein